ncbi:MAG: SDR family NAD(P)-dependent oxidoreductase [Chitinophagaceae bacterium]
MSKEPQKIIIVGATSGIGREMAMLYASKGCKVAVTGRRENLLADLKKIHPQNIITACFDVTANDLTDHLKNLVAELNGLDLFIYNAGYGDTSIGLNIEIENTTTHINVNSFVNAMHFAFNYFIGQGFGQIAITSSIAALRGNSWAPAYSASKAFMSNYAESLNIKAQKLKKNIVVTDIKPGFINTKQAKENKRFWVAPPQKAASQMVEAIKKKKRIAYITKRWWLIAQILKILPYLIYRRIG